MWRIADVGGIEQRDGGFLHSCKGRTHPLDPLGTTMRGAKCRLWFTKRPVKRAHLMVRHAATKTEIRNRVDIASGSVGFRNPRQRIVLVPTSLTSDDIARGSRCYTAVPQRFKAPDSSATRGIRTRDAKAPHSARPIPGGRCRKEPVDEATSPLWNSPSRSGRCVSTRRGMQALSKGSRYKFFEIFN
ncbi:hypothetical protein SAMN05446934_9604 [Paraburkholderia hospita]|nr:hypothetical protein SAMN05446934_9604 [Paraburkholderia hospita]